MITGFEWLIIKGLIGIFAGAATVAFWDDIKAWASRMLGYILDAINWAIEVTSDAITSLVKSGYRYYKVVEVWVRNIHSNVTKRSSRQEEAPPTSIPPEIKAQLDERQKMELMRTRT